mmetsp:Transcript_43011/g.106097  ORF Transcript_43011/g.106097 Transcript_43011/m.106097 type:complete len:313 (+) Transcript_43011:147-1085(+)
MPHCTPCSSRSLTRAQWLLASVRVDHAQRRRLEIRDGGGRRLALARLGVRLGALGRGGRRRLARGALDRPARLRLVSALVVVVVVALLAAARRCACAPSTRPLRLLLLLAPLLLLVAAALALAVAAATAKLNTDLGLVLAVARVAILALLALDALNAVLGAHALTLGGLVGGRGGGEAFAQRADDLRARGRYGRGPDLALLLCAGEAVYDLVALLVKAGDARQRGSALHLELALGERTHRPRLGVVHGERVGGAILLLLRLLGREHALDDEELVLVLLLAVPALAFALAAVLALRVEQADQLAARAVLLAGR